MFERRHYEAVAKTLGEVSTAASEEARSAFVSEFVAMFKADNPRFNSLVFREAVRSATHRKAQSDAFYVERVERENAAAALKRHNGPPAPGSD